MMSTNVDYTEPQSKGVISRYLYLIFGVYY